MTATNSSKRILLVDGNSIINRAFFALSGRSNLTAPDGTPTGAINTFLNTLNKHIEDILPTHVVTLFDRKEKTFRHEMYDGYKAKRKGMPDELAVQIPLLKDVLDAMNISRYELAGYEADDLIGTYAENAGREGYSVYILSGDKDDFQLIDSDTVVVMPVSKAGKTGSDIYDEEVFYARYGLMPDQFVTVKALMGDPSDNIPGVRGVGEKTALDLVIRYQTLDRIYENLNELPDGLRKKLLNDKESAYLSYDLSRIKRDVPAELSIDSFTVKEPDKDRVSDLFRRLGLRTQLKKAGLEDYVPYSSESRPDEASETAAGEGIPERYPEVELISDLLTFQQRTELLSEKKEVLIADVFEMGNGDDSTRFLILSFTPSRVIVIEEDRILEVLKIIAQRGFGRDPNRTFVGFSVKNTFKFLPEPAPIDSCFDTMIAGYLLNQIEGSSPAFETLYEHSAGVPYPLIPDGDSIDSVPSGVQAMLSDLMIPKKNKSEIIMDRSFRLIVWRAALMHSLYETQKKQIHDLGIEKLVYEIEMPLVLHLDNMERAGFFVDREFLLEMHENFEKKTEDLALRIYEQAGTTFNILSPKQLGQVLFDRLGLPSGRKNAGGGYSTDSDELDRLSNLHPVVPLLLEYRQISKLDSTFVIGLLKGIDPKDNRIHSSFSQAMTTTGRLSSAEPNLQNIPIRTEMGRLIRKAFIAPDGYMLLDADYSQIELRLLAHLSGDETMIRAFMNNVDIHTETASSIFKLPVESVLPHMRSAAKTVNFSIVYGISDYGLSQDLGVSIQEAHTYIEKYYSKYPKIREYLDSLKASGYDKGYVETMFKRRRNLRELTSPNRNVRMFGERAAMNTPIQGTAADIIKIAMNRVSKDLKQAGLQARLILQVHDELIIECAEKHIAPVSVILKNAMETAAVLTVPLISEVRVGKSWFECKE